MADEVNVGLQPAAAATALRYEDLVFPVNAESLGFETTAEVIDRRRLVRVRSAPWRPWRWGCGCATRGSTSTSAASAERTASRTLAALLRRLHGRHRPTPRRPRAGAELPEPRSAACRSTCRRGRASAPARGHARAGRGAAAVCCPRPSARRRSRRRRSSSVGAVRRRRARRSNRELAAAGRARRASSSRPRRAARSSSSR